MNLVMTMHPDRSMHSVPLCSPISSYLSCGEAAPCSTLGLERYHSRNLLYNLAPRYCMLMVFLSVLAAVCWWKYPLFGALVGFVLVLLLAVYVIPREVNRRIAALRQQHAGRRHFDMPPGGGGGEGGGEGIPLDDIGSVSSSWGLELHWKCVCISFFHPSSSVAQW